MIRNIVVASSQRFEWVDVNDPNSEEIQQLAAKYGLHEESVQDALQADHLPKYERLKAYEFVIIRVYSVDRDSEADTVKELTNKIAVFISPEFLITIHKHEWPEMDKVKNEFEKNGDPVKTAEVLNEIIRLGLYSFNEPANRLTRTIEYFEEHIFLRDRKVSLMRGLYFLKRKVDVLRRIILLTYDVVDHIDPPETSNVYTRDVRDLFVKQQNIFDSLAENTNHLVAIYFNISTQRTNETIRVLTIFSVFFMPLTFIVGIYGMNFDFMPELRYRWGYPAVLALMLLVVGSIFLWFRKKKWL